MKILVLLFGLIVALSPGEVRALDAMRAAWGKAVPGDWAGEASCAWLYIGCDAAQHVTDITLVGQGLRGMIPPEIGNLMSLVDLNLYDNLLSGSIPPEIGNLTRLAYLVLHDNQLKGSIPPELGNLTSLQVLDLSYNKLNGPIPPEIGSLTSLANLSLDDNQLSGPIPPEIGNLTNLVDLNLLNGSLSSLANLQNLMSLDISNCRLSGRIPDESELPPQLITISLASNSLSGPIPRSLMESETIVVMDLSSNNLTSLPSCGAASNLPPTGFANLLALTVNDTSLTNLTSICGLKKKLNSLAAAATGIVGTPLCLGDMDALEVLDLSHNNLGNPYDFVRLPVTLTTLNLKNTSQTVFPPAVTALSYRCATAACNTAVQIDAPLSLLDLSDNPQLSSGLFEADNIVELLYRNGTWVQTDLSTYPPPVFTNLAYLDISNSLARSFPESVFEPPLRVLFLSETRGLDVVGTVVRQGALVTDRTRPIYNNSAMWMCDSLLLRGRPTSQVVFHPEIYGYAFCQCQAGHFGVANEACPPCTLTMRQQAACGADGSQTVRHGYFPRTRAADSIDVLDVTDILTCVLAEACRPADDAVWWYDNHTGMLGCGHGAVGSLDVLCASGYRARLCTRCEDGWFVAGEAECEKCPDTSWWHYVVVAAAVVLALLIFVFLQSFGVVAIAAEVLVVLAMVVFSVGEAWTMTVVVLVVLLATVSQAEAADALVKSLLFFVQTLAVVAPRETWDALHGVWKPLESLGQLKFVNLHISGAECVWPALASPASHLWFVLALPVVFLVVTVIVVASGSLVRRTPPMRRAKAAYDGLWARVREALTPKRLAERLLAPDDWELHSEPLAAPPPADSEVDAGTPLQHHALGVLAEIVQSGLFVVYASYFEVVRRFLAVFRPCCHGYMAGGYSCDGDAGLYAAGGVGIAVYAAGVPLLLGACLAFAGVMMMRRRRAEASRWVGFLFEGYRAPVFWFEIVWTARRLALAVLLAVVPEQNAVGPFLVLAVLGISTIMQHFVRPFEGRLENEMELVSLVALTATYAVCQILEPGALLGNQQDSWDTRTLVVWFVIIGNTLVLVAFVLALASDYLVAVYEVIMARVHPQPAKFKLDDEPTNQELREENVMLTP